MSCRGVGMEWVASACPGVRGRADWGGEVET